MKQPLRLTRLGDSRIKRLLNDARFFKIILLKNLLQKYRIALFAHPIVAVATGSRGLLEWYDFKSS